MIRILNITIIWLLSIAAFCSCSKDASLPRGNAKVIISGTVSDLYAKSAIEGAEIKFQIYEENESASRLIVERSVYTDSKGAYSLMEEGFDSTIRCTLIVSHKDYYSESQEIIVNWSGTSYDSDMNTFFVNECNIHLKKI